MVATTASGGEAKPARVVAGAIDTLVRSLRSDPSYRVVTQRAVDVLRAHPTTLEIRATAIAEDDVVVFETGAAEGRWLFPAYLAGLRAIRARPDVSLEDAARFGEELASVRPQADSIRRLHEWLWAGGAEGFDVEVQACFCDALEDAAAAERAAREDGERARAMVVGDAPAGVDPASLRDHDAALAAHLDALRAGAYAIDEPDVDALRAACDDASAWLVAEATTALARTDLHELLTGARLARRIAARAAAGFDARALDGLAAVYEEDDPYRRDVVAALDEEGIGAAIARAIPLDDSRSVAALARFAAVASPAASGAIASRVVARASDDAVGAHALRTFVTAVGFDRFRGWLDEASLDRAGALALVRAAKAAGIQAIEIAALLERVTAACAVAALEAFDETELGEIAPALTALAAKVDGQAAEGLVKIAATHRLAFVLRALGDALLARGADGWSGKALYAVCGALVTEGLGMVYVVPLAKTRTVPTKARLVALDCIAERADLVADACKRRMSDLLEQPEILDRMARLRAKHEKRGGAR